MFNGIKFNKLKNLILYPEQSNTRRFGTNIESILRAVLFSVFINDIDSETECIFCRFADDRKLNSALETPEGRDAIQRDLEKLEKWVHENLMMVNKSMCNFLHLGSGNCRHWEYTLGEELIESSHAKKDLGLREDKKLDMRHIS
ncbi:rna-directed dna polymerase from mobile element jockey-like [Pitangus sulphuratus]|nr:rna-directed dna polymerase from mobile element jockey-like [Pitangus sulphuratus]